MVMRLVGQAAMGAATQVARATITPEQRHRTAVQFVRELTGGLKHDHLAYMVATKTSLFGVLPIVLQSACFAWIMKDYRGVIGMTDDEAITAALEARPDLADLMALPEGRAWFKDMISGRDLGLV